MGAEVFTMTMTKTQLTMHLAERMGEPMSKRKAAEFLDNLAETAVKETKKNGVFVLPGIGRLVKAHRKARMGRNPQTGEAIQIKAKTVVKFRVAKSVKEALSPAKAA
jgi:DNA-binding protein HU-beta